MKKKMKFKIYRSNCPRAKMRKKNYKNSLMIILFYLNKNKMKSLLKKKYSLN